MRFELAISLGNEAMQSPADVAGALIKLAYAELIGTLWSDGNAGTIRDAHGNTVGGWMVVA